MLVVKNCLYYYKFIYGFFGSIIVVKFIELEIVFKFCLVENVNILFKWYLFVKWVRVGKLMSVLIIFERVREEWWIFKDFMMKWGVREWITLNFRRFRFIENRVGG